MNRVQRVIYAAYLVLQAISRVAGACWNLARFAAQFFSRWVFRGRVTKPHRWVL